LAAPAGFDAALAGFAAAVAPDFEAAALLPVEREAAAFAVGFDFAAVAAPAEATFTPGFWLLLAAAPLAALDPALALLLDVFAPVRDVDLPAPLAGEPDASSPVTFAAARFTLLTTAPAASVTLCAASAITPFLATRASLQGSTPIRRPKAT
jgi:hypothetical protein